MSIFWGASLLDPRCHDDGSVFTTDDPGRVLQSLIMQESGNYVDTQRYEWGWKSGVLTGTPLNAADRLQPAIVTIDMPDLDRMVGPLVDGRLLVFNEPITAALVIDRINEIAGKVYLDVTKLDVALSAAPNYNGEQVITVTPAENVYLFQGELALRALYSTSAIVRYFNTYTDGFMGLVDFLHQISILDTANPEQMFDTTGYRLTGFDGMVFDIHPDDMLELRAGMTANMYGKLYLPQIPVTVMDAGTLYNLVYEVVELPVGAKLYVGADTDTPATEVTLGATGALMINESFNVRIQGEHMSKALVRVRVFRG